MTAPRPTPQTIEHELAALGEEPLSPEELALLEQAAGEDLEHEAIAGVTRLAELAEPFAFAELSQLETHRGWRAVEPRLQGADERSANGPGPAPAGGPRRWLLAAVGVAAAAAVVALIVLRPGASPELAAESKGARDPAVDPAIDPAEVAELGAQARATLAVLDGGLSDTQRAEQLAAEYQRRLEEHGG